MGWAKESRPVGPAEIFRYRRPPWIRKLVRHIDHGFADELFRVRDEFPDEWYRFFDGGNDPTVQKFSLALTPDLPHMSTPAIYAALIGFSVFFTWLGLRKFQSRALD